MLLPEHCYHSRPYTVTVVSISPVGIPKGTTGTVVVAGDMMPDVASDTTAFGVYPTATCSSTVASTSVAAVGSGTSLTLTVASTGTASGAYFLCVRWLPTSTRISVAAFNVFSVSTRNPPGLPTMAARTVVLTGAGLIDVSAVPDAFVLSASCAPGAVASVVGPITSTWTSTTAMSITMDATASTAGAFRLCLRVSATSPYGDMIALNILSFTSVTPATIPNLVRPVTVAGVGFVTVNSDASAFVLAATDCTALTSAVTSISSASTAVRYTLTVTATGASGGTYPLCLRMSATTAYFDTGLHVNIGEWFPCCRSGFRVVHRATCLNMPLGHALQPLSPR